jgi:hypothetical protein
MMPQGKISLSDRKLTATTVKCFKIGVGSGGRTYDTAKNKAKERITVQFYYLLGDTVIPVSKQNDRKVTATSLYALLLFSSFCRIKLRKQKKDNPARAAMVLNM